MRRLLLLLLAFILIGPAIAGADKDAAPAEKGEKADKVYRLPDFRVKTLDGAWFDTEEQRGKVLLVDLWATWCGPCMAVAPAMEKIYADYHERGVVMLGIAVDSGGEDEVRKAAGEFGMSYPVALWSSYLAERIQGLDSLPTYILVRPDGTIAKLWIGATSPKTMRAEIDRILDDGTGDAR